MTLTVAILASGLGAVARHLLATSVQARVPGARPWGTAVVNLLGAVLLGALAGLHAAGHLTADTVTVLGVGFLGGFTTFSTWMVETIRLVEGDGDGAGLRAAVANLLAMLVAGVVGVALSTWVV